MHPAHVLTEYLDEPKSDVSDRTQEAANTNLLEPTYPKMVAILFTIHLKLVQLRPPSLGEK